MVQPDEYRHRTDRPLGEIVKELRDGVRDVVRSEIHLAKAEAKVSANRAKKQVTKMVIFGGMALLGALPLIAFAVIGLGAIMGGLYWLSALIVGLVMVAVGAGVAYSAAKKMGRQDYSLPTTRDSVRHEQEVISRKMHEVSDSTRRRAA